MITVESIYNMLLGERRKIVLDVTIDGARQGFTLRSASYTLTGSDKTLDGPAEISDNQITLYLEPEKAGAYKLTVSFSVGDEIIKKRLTVRVEE